LTFAPRDVKVGAMNDEQAVVAAIEAELTPSGFVAKQTPATFEEIEVVSAWVRKTWQTNRGVVVLRVPPGAHPGPLSHRLKIPIGKALGYFPFFYGMGLQLVWIGSGITPLTPDLDGFVDSIDNQRSIVQSIFVVDVTNRRAESARTWGQVITGRFQDAIERGIALWAAAEH
jgi:hypothetical protein